MHNWAGFPGARKMRSIRQPLRLNLGGLLYTHPSPPQCHACARWFHANTRNMGAPRSAPERPRPPPRSQPPKREPSPEAPSPPAPEPPKEQAPSSPPSSSATQPPLHKAQSIRVNTLDQAPQYPTREDRSGLAAAHKFFSGDNARFLYSATILRHHAKDSPIPEVALLGASNVGKSTLVNALVGDAAAARVSQHAGHTITMNAYGVGPPDTLVKTGAVARGQRMPDHGLVLVDTPGYGYRSKKTWGRSVVQFLERRTPLRGAVVLVGIKKSLSDNDVWVLEALARTNTRLAVVLTKADKSEDEWIPKCQLLAHALRETLTRLSTDRWKEGDGWDPNFYVTAAGMPVSGKLGNGGGLGGVRMAILEMAGYQMGSKQVVDTKPENVSYDGEIVSFDDIQWKS